MHVYLDANIFHGHWHLDATNFRVLARFLNNEGHTLFLSRLVIQEVENLHRRGLDSAYQQMQKAAKDFGRLTHGHPPALPDRASIPRYDLEALARTEFDQLDVVEYDTVKQSVVALRARERQGLPRHAHLAVAARPPEGTRSRERHRVHYAEFE